MNADRYDLVVVGHGAAGLSAAVAAAEAAPAARIVVLEHLPEASSGGNTRWSPANTRMISVDAMAPGFVGDMLAAGGGRGDRAYYERIAAEGPATIRWLEGHGVRFRPISYFLSPQQIRLQPVGNGAAIVDALRARAQALGIELRYETRVTRLHLDSGGATDAIETGSGERIAARAIVLASGGFGGDPAMLAEHVGPGAESFRPISPGSATNRGDGIRMALAIGALPAGDWQGMHAEPVDPRSERPAALVLVYPYGIVVDRDGSRFFDEGGGLVHETWEHLARAIQFDTPERSAWVVLDAGLAEIAGHEAAIKSEVPPLRADTLAGLAAAMGVPEEALERSVASYNAACPAVADGFDPGRLDGLATAPGLAPPKTNWARPLDRPPYLAFPLIGAIVYTFGGLATDVDARVLGPAGPIPGLYAAGEITGHFHGTAPNAVAVLRALVYGRIAGRNAVARAG